MRFAQIGLYAMLVILGRGYADRTAPDEPGAAGTATSAASLPCDETEQTAVVLDVPARGGALPRRPSLP